jgi:hypothetical protein
LQPSNGHRKHPVFRQSFANVTAIARDSLCNQAMATGSTRQNSVLLLRCTK